MATAREPSGIFPLELLRDSEPMERDGKLYRWKGRRPLITGGPRIGIVIEAQEAAIRTGNGSFDMHLSAGRGALRRAETWRLMSNRDLPHDEDETPKTPLLDLYLLRTTGESLLLPKVPEATKVARFYPDHIQLFSRYKDLLNALDIGGVMVTIHKVTHSIATSSRNNTQSPR